MQIFFVIKGFKRSRKVPNGDLLLGDDGNFYGMTLPVALHLPRYNFKTTSAGEIAILKQLNGSTDGQYPYGELIKGADGNFYGVTSSGGTNTYEPFSK